MNLNNTSITFLDQLAGVILQMKKEDYGRKTNIIGASIGEHTRHIVEFYFCLMEATETGVVNYDARKRDQRIQQDKDYAGELIVCLKDKLKGFCEDPELELLADYHIQSEVPVKIKTNFSRELVYNIEHTIHHMAIMRPAFSSEFTYVNLRQEFGVAVSTLRFRKKELSNSENGCAR